MSSKQFGKWICIDGVEGSGKTTIAKHLASTLEYVRVSEFSTSPIGKALRGVVRKNPHYILKSPLGQSLIFLGDFIELVHDRVIPALKQGRTVVTDRGFLSKYAYQEVVLESAMTTSQARGVLDKVFYWLPKPDVTIVLTAPRSVLRQRIINRGETCRDDRLAFMDRASLAAQEYVKRHPSFKAAIIDSNAPVHDTLKKIRARFPEFLVAR